MQRARIGFRVGWAPLRLGIASNAYQTEVGLQLCNDS